MDLDRIREIIDLIAESGVSEIEVEEEGLRIVVRKHQQMTGPGPVEVQHIQAAPPPPPSDQPEIEVVAGTEVRAPIVGTFFRAPSPDADAFVNVGDHVKPGDVLCIIEAMKLMNEIECEVDGMVKEILIENASPIEYDQPLFIIG